MKEINDYGEVFENIVQKIQDYLIRNHLSVI